MAEPTNSRSIVVALLFVLLVFVVQSWYGHVFGHGVSDLWSTTLLLLVPSIAWLVARRGRASQVSTGIMAALMFGSNHLGSLMPFGYIASFWVGLPLASLASWYVSKDWPLASGGNGA
jgi:hypothetical protein